MVCSRENPDRELRQADGEVEKGLPAFGFDEVSGSRGTGRESHGPAAFLTVDVHDDRCFTGGEVHGRFEDHEIGTDLGERVRLAVRYQLKFDYRGVPIC